MFSGIIQGIGIVNSIEKNTITIETNLNLNDCIIGSSICCDGICLTIISIKLKNNMYKFQVNVSEETLERSTCKSWKIGLNLNIEKSIKVGDELAGHFVYGHVDLTVKILKIKELNSSWNFYFSLPKMNDDKKNTKFIVEKGSIAINGISLTIASLNNNSFNVSIIPHTYNNTNLSNFEEGDMVNIEFDPLYRYIHSRND